MKKNIIAIMILTVLMSLSYSASPTFSGLGDLIKGQNEASFETEGSTPRISKRKRAEYREGKSPLTAAGLSLLMPGAGEFYGRDYIRSGVFFGIEVLTLSMWYYYKSDGDGKRDDYRNYADRNFDENLYYGGLLGMTQNVKTWLENKNSENFSAADYWNYDYFSGRDNWTHDIVDSLAVVDFLTLSFGTFNQDHIDPRIDAYWVRQQELFGSAAQFTHNLPDTKTQQYYEMIGKYHQFSCGWNDFDGYKYNDDGTVKMVADSIMASDGTYHVLERPDFVEGVFNYSENGYNSPQVDLYEDLRHITNQAYDKGQNFLMITLLNHVASAFNASYVIKSRYQIDTQLEVGVNDSAQKLGADNYKLTYSVRW